ncbi:MAG: hypothetical protein PUB18_00830 [bacterium]|nr:hypothetical protein [bacterium]
MGYIKRYLNIISYLLLGIVFSCSSFYLFINVFHFLELNQSHLIVVADQDIVLDYDQKIHTIKSNIEVFNRDYYHGEIDSTAMLKIQQGLQQCVSILNSTYLEKVRDQSALTIVDIYMLHNSFKNEILSDCILGELYWAISLKENSIVSSYLENNQMMLQLYVDSLKNKTLYLEKDLLNNSSYFFQTNIMDSEVKNNIRDGFFEIFNAYNQACSYVEFLSEWFSREVRAV